MISKRACWPWVCGVGALTALWPSACVVNELGTAWEWNVAMGANTPASTEIVVDDQTLHVEVERALVSIVALEAIPCAGVDATATNAEFSPLSAARAHGGTTPTRMAIPHVVDLLSVDGSHWASALSHPPPDSYCWARLTIGPADRDAVGMPSDEDLTGLALVVRGRYSADNVGNGSAFTVSSARTQSIDVAFVNTRGELAPLVVSESQRNVAVDVWLQAPRVLEGVDPTSTVETLGGLHAITNVLASVHAMGCIDAPCAER